MHVLQEHTVSSHIVYYVPFFVCLWQNTNPCKFSDTKQQCSAARTVVVCNRFFIHSVTGPWCRFEVQSETAGTNELLQYLESGEYWSWSNFILEQAVKNLD